MGSIFIWFISNHWLFKPQNKLPVTEYFDLKFLGNTAGQTASMQIGKIELISPFDASIKIIPSNPNWKGWLSDTGVRYKVLSIPIESPCTGLADYPLTTSNSDSTDMDCRLTRKTN